jgi:hypothetical protein
MEELLNKVMSWWDPLPRVKKWKYLALFLVGFMFLLLIF